MQQQQICPRCKFRLTMVKSICPTCGYALQMTRKPEGVAPAAPKPVQNTVSSTVSNRPASTNTASTARKAQAAQTGGGGSFWRAFLGLDPLPAESPDRDDHAYGET